MLPIGVMALANKIRLADGGRDGDRMVMVVDERMPEPGDILHYDFRPINKDTDCPRMLKAVQWNIERGYRLPQIISILAAHQADIICLQELDIGCDRTARYNVPEKVAEALGMKCVFVTEFAEHRSRRRSARTQGGGVHGNAILSRFDMDPFIIPHTYHPVNWSRDGSKINEPRHGERVILGANIHVPGYPTPIRAYSLHLEVFCGIYGRLRQFADVMEDAKRHMDECPLQMIFGDLNTMAHGIARLSPLYCSDRLRLLSLGYSEAQWWQKNIFDQAFPHTQTDLSPSSLAAHVPHRLPLRTATSLLNPHFYDPFCVTADTTLHGYAGLFRGKLDWTLMRGMHVLEKGMDNHDLGASDHKLLYVVVRPCEGESGEELQIDVERAYHEGRVPINHSYNFFRSIAGTLITAALLAIIAVFWKNYY